MERFKKAVIDGEFSYTPETNKSLLERARQEASKMSVDTLYAEYMASSKLDAKTLVQGQILARKLFQAGRDEEGMQVSAKLAEDVGMSAGMMRAWRMLKEMTPEGRMLYAERMIRRIQDKLYAKYGDKAKTIVIPDHLKANLWTARTEQEIDDAYSLIAQDIASQLPSSIGDKLNAWRYLAMLGNPRTHIRNKLGNWAFYPINTIRDYVATGIESIAQKAGLIDERTRSIVNSRKDRETLDFARKYYDDNIKKDLMSDAKYELSGRIEKYRSPFSNDNALGFTLNRLVKANNDALNKADVKVSKERFAKTLTSYMKANNLTPEDVDTDQFMKAREMAVKESLEATYREDNAVANAINKFRNINTGTKIITDALLPFTRTPMNIIKRGFEYSPLNLLYTVTKGSVDLKKGKINANEYITNLSSGLTGTGIALLGYFLASKGILRTTDDDKDRKQRFDEDLGEQDYALVFPHGTYTIDWATPAIMPLAIGVEIFKLLTSNDKDFTDLGDASISLIGELVSPIAETSMISSFVNSIPSNTDDLGQFTAEMAGNALYLWGRQNIPTFVSQLARMVDPFRRTTYPNEGWLDQKIRTTKNAIPFLSMQNEPYINRLGEAELNEDLGLDAMGRFILNAISPGYWSSDISTPETDEMLRL